MKRLTHFGRVVVELSHFSIAIYKAVKARNTLEAWWSAHETSDPFADNKIRVIYFNWQIKDIAMATEAKTDSAPSKVPEWLQGELFIDVLRNNVSGFSKIKSFNAKSGSAAGENYATIMLRVNIDVELEGTSCV